ncbi:MAG TPA: MFS transporter, partial [Anaerolineales bacterium]
VSAFAVLRQPLTIKLALPVLLIGLGAAILLPYTNLFYVERYGVSNELLGVLFSLAALLTCLGSLLAPRLAVSLGGKIRAVVFTQASSLIFMLLMGFAPFAGLSAGAYLLRGMLMNMAYPLMDSFSMGLVAEGQQGTVNSVRSMANQVGWALGPFISGLIQESLGFAPLFVIATLLYAVATGAVWKFFHKVEPLFEAVPPEIERIAPQALEIIQG